MSNVNIPIEKFIPEAKNILEILYEDCSGVVNIKGLDDLLSLPTGNTYYGDISRFKCVYDTLKVDISGIVSVEKDAVEIVEDVKEVVDIIEPLF